MKARELRRILQRKPLEYKAETSAGGSHRWLVSPRYPRLRWAFHDRQNLPPGLVHKILSRDVGLSEEEIRDIL